MPVLLRMPISEDNPDAVIEVEVDPQDLGEGVELMAGRTHTATARQSLVAGLQQVLPALDAMLAGLRSVSADEVQIQLGLRVGGESGLVFVKAGAEATFSVTLRWRGDAS